MNSFAVFHHQAEQPETPATMQRPAPGTRVTVNAMGRAVAGSDGGPTWNHPWRPFLAGNSLTFNIGIVQSLAGAQPLEPIITSKSGEKLPMSGKDGSTPTPLPLDAAMQNANGESWAVLEVHPDDNGELQADALVQIIHTDSPISHALTFGRCPLAQILWNGNAPLQAIPIVHFNLRYLRFTPQPGTSGIPKHLFL